MYINTWREGAKKSQAFFTGAQWQDQRQWAQPETQEIPSKHQETLIHSEGDQA